MLTMVFTKPKKWKIFLSRLINELENIGISSLPIVALMSTFIGGVIALYMRGMPFSIALHSPHKTENHDRFRPVLFQGIPESPGTFQKNRKTCITLY